MRPDPRRRRIHQLSIVTSRLQWSKSLIFIGTRLQDVWLVAPERHEDERGFFARTWCEREFSVRQLGRRFVQSSVSFNPRSRTLRGMHYQRPPHAEAKLVRCTRGAAYDVVVDLRKDSPTYMQWGAFELTMHNGMAVYIPEGCAHGFLTLADETEMLYQMSDFYDAQSAAGFRWDDPMFRIQWPESIGNISSRDLEYPDFKP
jgi:dTDP-4-dehydrorhamnose 3,5-epimerase